MISIIEESKADDCWNDRMLKSGLGTIYQSKERADFLLKVNQKSLFLKFINEEKNIVGQLLVHLSPRFTNKGIKGKIFDKIPNVKKNKCNWAYGPIILSEKYNDEIFLALKKFFDSKKLAVDGWTHPMIKQYPNRLKNDFSIINWSTFTINLERDENEIFNNISKHSGRKNIERSKKRGVKIEEIDEDSLIEYFRLKNTTKLESGQEKTDFEPMMQRWKKFRNLGYSGFLARHEGNPIGGLLFSYVNKYILEIGVARSKFDTSNNLYSQDLIKWSIIEWGIKNKMKFYDLTGFNPNPTSEKEKGIARYKEKWGGERKDYIRILEKSPKTIGGQFGRK